MEKTRNIWTKSKFIFISHHPEKNCWWHSEVFSSSIFSSTIWDLWVLSSGITLASPSHIGRVWYESTLPLKGLRRRQGLGLCQLVGQFPAAAKLLQVYPAPYGQCGLIKLRRSCSSSITCHSEAAILPFLSENYWHKLWQQIFTWSCGKNRKISAWVWYAFEVKYWSS